MDTACILTTRGRVRGYGIIHIKGKTVYEHRLAYCKANGLLLADIAGKVVRHRCDNPACINPEHLVLGTVQDNVDDREFRRRGNHEVKGKRGEENNANKLTELQVAEIKGHTRYTQRQLAEMYNVNQSTILRILQGKTWAWVLPKKKVDVSDL